MSGADKRFIYAGGCCRAVSFYKIFICRRVRYRSRIPSGDWVGHATEKQERGRARAGRRRHRLRRHRHQSAVHAEDHFRPRARAGAHAGQPDRRRIADLLGLDRHCLLQIRGPGPACGQPRRRRHHGAPGARAGRRRRPQAPALRAAPDRGVRRFAVLWRQRDHAGDLGPVGDRRPGGRRSSSWSACTRPSVMAPPASAAGSDRSCCCGSRRWRRWAS